MDDPVSVHVREMASAWARGRPVAAEDVLAEHPELNTEQAVRLVYEEVCLRREAGQAVATAEVVRRFPQFRDELEFLLDADRLMRPLAKAAELPEAGEDLGPFRLLAELGRGASGRTYIAAEPALADRQVVLKVMAADQEEHLSLARLQHTHIIPLFSEHTFADRGLRALCMPYLGGASLGAVLEAVAKVPPGGRRGRDILDAMDAAQKGRPAPASSDGPYRRYLEQAPYVKAICWIGACLADALHEAHAHRLVHMDVKPSNVLIAGDGLPMLLDFHLARNPIKPSEAVADRLGGTPGWMAPEQAAAMDAVGAGRPVPGAVDHRADIYALGLLLREALGGPGMLAAPPAAAARLRARNPEVSVGLADVLDRCTAPRPEDRYPDAAELADDLRRHITDQPLRGVPNRSPAERWRKWRRRRPGGLIRTASWALAAAFLAGGAAAAWAYFGQRVDEVVDRLHVAQRLRREHRYSEAADLLRLALARADGVPAVHGLRRELGAELHAAELGRKATELHELAEIVRFRHSLPTAAAAADPGIRQLLDRWEATWGLRATLLGQPAGTLDAETEQAIRTDLLELALLWADLRVRQAPRGRGEGQSGAAAAGAREEALAVLDEADKLCGPSPALNRQRRALRQAAGGAPEDARPDPPPRSAWEHYDLGRYYLRAGMIAEAAAELDEAVALNPSDFWANFQQGLCAYALGRFEDAIAAFRACIALNPEAASPYYNRALAEEATGRAAHALDDYRLALARDPGMTSALLNRGKLLLEARRPAEAAADLERALPTTTDRPTLARIEYALALARLALGDRPAALAAARKAAALGHPQARDLADRLSRGDAHRTYVDAYSLL
ncbi:Serine/threonine-protein kinase Pkn1 [Aquisphaera giovannonii]|uniref:Serine/threonine-protein kinase Pkn1 n=1 Tax=Aquisphaera giovannonii TaxID=406548 RepID=A0A5B9W3F7_9BACT|nr:serine/threonine-protein kinase [Aquisphaera giovannonii]QEH35122.1 Serine/threonine-protein kinase Pkn1 [Aquisphaera giovannonii]